MPHQPEPAARPYRGVARDARRSERRAQLIAAAIAVYGQRGYRQASVKAVCETAALTERYFYESFANSDALLVASFEHVAAGLTREIAAAARGATQAERARQMAHTYFAALRRDASAARVFLVEVRGVSPVIDAAFERALAAMAVDLGGALGLRRHAGDLLLQLGVLGGITQIATTWIQRGYTPAIGVLTDTALRLAVAMLDPEPEPEPAPPPARVRAKR